MRLQDSCDVVGVARDICDPSAEAALLIYGSDPLGEELSLGSVFLGILTFDFQHEHFAVLEAD